MSTTQRTWYLGFSGIQLEEERSIGIGTDITLQPVYAHVFSAPMIAFNPPRGPGQHHPGPWVAGTGGYEFDVFVEAVVGTDDLDQTARLLSALMRLRVDPRIRLVAAAQQSFKHADAQEQFKIHPIETAAFRNLQPLDAPVSFDASTATWFDSFWDNAKNLYTRDGAAETLMEAISQCSFSASLGLALVELWGSLQRLMTQGQFESALRLSTGLSAYLEPPGLSRRELADQVTKLYSKRSKAAHGSATVDLDAFVQSNQIARRVAIQIIEHGAIPTADDIKNRLYCV